MPAKETAKISEEQTPTDELVSPAQGMALGSNGLDMEVLKQMLLQMQQQMQEQLQNVSARLDRLESSICNLGTHDFRYDFTIFFIYMNSYLNS